ncbi:multiple epidermal growth factor-like domains protein 6 [Trichonephila clavipes]|nr:multiple epidermal growth factor-like domains protein 6 [Trichonephila clavipes]
MFLLLFVEDDFDFGPVRGDLPEVEYAVNKQKMIRKKLHGTALGDAPLSKETALQTCISGFFGGNCSYTCDDCKNRAKCRADKRGCVCRPGYTGILCDTPCPEGRHGKKCRERCICRGEEVCDHMTGACYCPYGTKGDEGVCRKGCPKGTFGQQCERKCPKSCPTGYCQLHNHNFCICPPGRRGRRCTTRCPHSYYGPNCLKMCKCIRYNTQNNTETCHPQTGQCNCKEGWSGKSCNIPCSKDDPSDCMLQDGVSMIVCEGGFYGPHCDRPCDCVNAISCDPLTGQCLCFPGWKGQRCDEGCEEGSFGVRCEGNCKCPKCDSVTGLCLECPPGRRGSHCREKCSPGRFGAHCKHRCRCENGASCDLQNGTCLCRPGFTGARCEHACPAGWYGERCSIPCHCLNGGRCTPNTGECQCQAGYMGALCEQACPKGWFGRNCSGQCKCGDYSCHPVQGTCLCPPGLTGYNCQSTCPPKRFGPSCAFRCHCRHGAHCDALSGRCKCPASWTGSACHVRTDVKSS